MTQRNEVFVALLDPSSLGGDATLLLEATYLDNEEQVRYSSYQHKASQRNFLCGRVLAKSLVGRLLGCAARKVRIAYHANGKPVVADPISARSISVSISHTDGMVVVGLSSSSRLGVDVEKLSRPAKHLPLSNRILAEHELRDVLAYSQAERVDRFLQYWTLKEAWAKAVGLGLSARCSEVIFDLSPSAASAAAPSGFRTGEHWHTSLVRIGSKHLLAICACGKDAISIEWLVWDPRRKHEPLSQAAQRKR